MFSRLAAAVSTLFLFATCSSTSLRTIDTPISVTIAPLTQTSVPEVRGYDLSQIGQLLREVIAEDFADSVRQVTIGDSDPSRHIPPRLTVTVAPDSYFLPLPLSDQLRKVDRQIVWFRLDYTIETATGETRRGSISAYGPEPMGFDAVQRDQRTVIKDAVVQLRRAVLSALAAT